MRLFLLPISTRRALIYCEPLPQVTPTSERSYLDRAVNKANTTWSDWENSNTKWKLKLTEYGNWMFHRIPFEEWGLKSIPAMKSGSRRMDESKAVVGQPGGAWSDQEKTRARQSGEKMVEVKYPAMFQGLIKEPVLQLLHRLGTERQALHQKPCLIYPSSTSPSAATRIGEASRPGRAMHLKLPTLSSSSIVQFLVNISTALNGSRHLEHLASSGLLKPTPSNTLDSLYTLGLLHPTRSAAKAAREPSKEEKQEVVTLISKQMNAPPTPTQPPYNTSDLPLSSKAPDGGQEVMLLPRWNGKLIAERLRLPALEVEIERAVAQVEKALKAKQGEDIEAVRLKEVAQAQPVKNERGQVGVIKR